MEFEAYLDRISERNVGRWDICALFEEYQVLEDVVADYVEPFRDHRIDAVAGIDALGFVLGTGVAMALHVGFLPVRKGGKLPISDEDRLSRELTDYTGNQKTLEIDRTRVSSEMRVLVVDDIIETAAQMEAATALIEEAGGSVVGIAVLDAGDTERTNSLATAYDLHTVNPAASV